MNRGELLSLYGLLALLAIAREARSAVVTNEYDVISRRNIFCLKPAAKPAPEPKVKWVPRKVLLTGMTTVLGSARVLIKTLPPVAKAGEGLQKEQFYILRMGQSEDGIELLDVDVKALRVTIRNGDAVQSLSFDRDGVSLVAAAAPPPPPGVLGTRFAIGR